MGFPVWRERPLPQLRFCVEMCRVVSPKCGSDNPNNNPETSDARKQELPAYDTPQTAAEGCLRGVYSSEARWLNRL